MDRMSYTLKRSITFILALNLTLLSNHPAKTQNNVPSPNLHQWGAVTLFHGLPFGSRARRLSGLSKYYFARKPDRSSS